MVNEQDDAAQLGLVLRALPFGILFGTAVIAMVLWLVRTLQMQSPPATTTENGGPQAMILLGGTLAGVLAAGAATWSLLKPVESLYRRGALSLVAGFASLVAALIAMPLDRAFGRMGLLALAAAAVLGCLWLGRNRNPRTR
ncbi:MAG TPA: hypothetical protein VLB12_09930 [Gemmatimonadales bacterium]|nr:hypothetical protein [Gemmatimonadales bacterium]